MIQTILTLLLILCHFITLGQESIPKFPIDSTTKKITYTDVINLDSSITKVEIHSRAMEWFANRYKSSKNVIQLEDKEAGKIICKALMTVKMKNFGGVYHGGYINYTFSFYSREGRYKYVISDFYHEGVAVGGGRVPDGGSLEKVFTYEKGFFGNSYKGTWLFILQQMDKNIKALVSDLKTFMTINTKEEEW